MHWLEPAWKLLLASKGLLAVLWEQYQDHPLLLPASLSGPPLVADGCGDRHHRSQATRYVKKPLFSREGNNVTIHGLGDLVSTEGPDGEGGFVYQEYVELPDCDGFRPVIGAWLVDGEPAGMGIRETRGLITNNTAQFVPHIIRT